MTSADWVLAMADVASVAGIRLIDVVAGAARVTGAGRYGRFWWLAVTGSDDMDKPRAVVMGSRVRLMPAGAAAPARRHDARRAEPGSGRLEHGRRAAMSVLVNIGDFSRMTHLSVKALRHYHDVGLLEPAEIDRFSGYRFYDTEQVPVAQVIRRFRDLGMPVTEVRAMLDAGDVDTRNKVIVAHLERMESQLAETASTVASLRAMLGGEPSPAQLEFRSVGPTLTLALRVGRGRGRLRALVGNGLHGAAGGARRSRPAAKRARLGAVPE